MCGCGRQPIANAFTCTERCECTVEDAEPLAWGPLHWIIVGGESGFSARPFDITWASHTLMRCRDYEVACFIKQLGDNPVAWYINRAREHLPGGGLYQARYTVRASKGGDPIEWPEALRVRQFPESRA